MENKKVAAPRRGFWVVVEMSGELEWGRVVANIPCKKICRVFTLEDVVQNCPSSHTFLTPSAARISFPKARFYDYDGQLAPTVLPPNFVYDINELEKAFIEDGRHVTVEEYCDVDNDLSFPSMTCVVDPPNDTDRMCWENIFKMEEDTPPGHPNESCHPEGVWIVLHLEGKLFWGKLMRNCPGLEACQAIVNGSIISVPNCDGFMTHEAARLAYPYAIFRKEGNFEPNPLPVGFAYDVDVFSEFLSNSSGESSRGSVCFGSFNTDSGNNSLSLESNDVNTLENVPDDSVMSTVNAKLCIAGVFLPSIYLVEVRFGDVIAKKERQDGLGGMNYVEFDLDENTLAECKGTTVYTEFGKLHVEFHCRSKIETNFLFGKIRAYCNRVV